MSRRKIFCMDTLKKTPTRLTNQRHPPREGTAGRLRGGLIGGGSAAGRKHGGRLFGLAALRLHAWQAEHGNADAQTDAGDQDANRGNEVFHASAPLLNRLRGAGGLAARGHVSPPRSSVQRQKPLPSGVAWLLRFARRKLTDRALSQASSARYFGLSQSELRDFGNELSPVHSASIAVANLRVNRYSELIGNRSMRLDL